MTRERGEHESGESVESGVGLELVTEPVGLTAIAKGWLGVSGAECGPLGGIVRIRQLDPASRRVVLRLIESSPYSIVSEWSGLRARLDEAISHLVLLGIYGESGELQAFALGARGLDALCSLSEESAELRDVEYMRSDRRLEGFSEEDGFLLAIWCDERLRRKRFATALMHALMVTLRNEGAERVISFVRYTPRRVRERVFDWDKLFSEFLSRSGFTELGTHSALPKTSTVFVYGRSIAALARESDSGAIETRGVGRGAEGIEITSLPEAPAAK